MDSTVIQEIANQLGMAVDQAGQFITEQLPAFAALKVVQCIVPLVIAWVVFLVLAIVAITAIAMTSKSVKKAEEKHSWRSDYEDYFSFYVFVFAGVLALVALFVATIVSACAIPDIIGWSQYPEAMLIDMALKAVG